MGLVRRILSHANAPSWAQVIVGAAAVVVAYCGLREVAEKLAIKGVAGNVAALERPRRLVDTRANDDPGPKGAVPTGGRLTVQIPADTLVDGIVDSTGYVLVNLTSTGSTGAGCLLALAPSQPVLTTGVTRPLCQLAFGPPANDESNLAVVKVERVDGRLEFVVHNQSSEVEESHVVVDLVGVVGASS